VREQYLKLSEVEKERKKQDGKYVLNFIKMIIKSNVFFFL